VNKILIKQAGRKCQVVHNGEVVLESGRVACKGFALGLHIKTGDPLFNVKRSGAEVRIPDWKPRQPISPAS